jgi:dGTPase
MAYACRPDQTRGRLHDEPDSRFRNAFQRDRDRIIHCSAFRRLKYKTQVFVYHQGDHYRTRLTHTLEVAQVARTLARALMVNEDLAETVALAHDLGHTPFAHLGEDTLSLCMKPFEGFDHNDQSLRVLTHLEERYPSWRGLNLTWETLEGVVKPNGPVTKIDLPYTLKHFQKTADLELNTYASLEAQVAALADDIAYNNHDVADGLYAGLFTLDDVCTVPIFGGLVQDVKNQWTGISQKLLITEAVRRMLGAMAVDVLDETQRRLKDINPQSPDDIRHAGRQLVAFSDDMLTQVDELRAFLRERMYHHFTLNRMRHKVGKIVGDLFGAFMGEYQLLPDEWQDAVVQSGGGNNETLRARVVADYIAGMTDRFAIEEHRRLFQVSEELR